MIEWLDTTFLGFVFSVAGGASIRTFERYAWWQVLILALAITLAMGALLFTSHGVVLDPLGYAKMVVFYTAWSFVGFAIGKLIYARHEKIEKRRRTEY
jgi:hypothetical protein